MLGSWQWSWCKLHQQQIKFRAVNIERERRKKGRKEEKYKDLLCSCCSVTKSCPTLCNPMNCSTPGFPVLHHLLEFAQTHVHWVSDVIHYLIPYYPQSLLASGSLHQVANVLEFNFSISPSSEYSGLISFRSDQFELLAVQGTLGESSPAHSSKASILQCSAFFMLQLSHPYTILEKP